MGLTGSRKTPEWPEVPKFHLSGFGPRSFPDSGFLRGAGSAGVLRSRFRILAISEGANSSVGHRSYEAPEPASPGGPGIRPCPTSISLKNLEISAVDVLRMEVGLYEKSQNLETGRRVKVPCVRRRVPRFRDSVFVENGFPQSRKRRTSVALTASRETPKNVVAGRPLGGGRLQLRLSAEISEIIDPRDEGGPYEIP